MAPLVLQLIMSFATADSACDGVVISKTAETNEQIRCFREQKLWSAYYGAVVAGLKSRKMSANEIANIPTVRIDAEKGLGEAAFEYLSKENKIDPKSIQRLRELSQVYLFREKQFQKSSLLGVWMKADNQLSDESTYLTAASFYLRKDPVKALEFLKSFEPKSQKVATLSDLLRARSHLARGEFDKARDHYLKIPAQDPLWLDAMVELGWAYIHRRDFPGSIGQVSLLDKMPKVVAPASSAQQTIGYLSLCQYPSAYKSLSTFEHRFGPWRSELEGMLEDKDIYQTLIRDLKAQDTRGAIFQSLARRRDFIIWQKAVNALIDEEQPILESRKRFLTHLKIEKEKLNSLQSMAQKNRRRLNGRSVRGHERKLLEADLVDVEGKVHAQNAVLERLRADELKLNARIEELQTERLNRLKYAQTSLSKILGHQVLDLNKEITRLFDLNEIFRFEVFAGSGENVRAMVTGGSKGRLPASVKPTVKSLSWSFSGEVWLDEAGHMKSVTENLCTK
jgi:hypothetical protein